MPYTKKINNIPRLRQLIRARRLFLRLKNGFGMLIPGIVGLVLIYFLAHLFVVASFKIPTNSMWPALLPGDHILVQKLSLGPRLFDLSAALEKKEVSIYRLPGWGKINYNDIVVFNFPLSPNWKRIEFDVLLYYAKRCIALPGDTLEVRHSRYHVRGLSLSLGDESQQLAAQTISLSDLDEGVAYWSPRETGWSLHEAGPFRIPAKGTRMEMTPLHARLYGRLIEWEQNLKLELRGDTVLLAGKRLYEYCFRENYYFMAGDQYLDSMDSRYWGLVPEEFIVGKAFLIWRSLDPQSKRFRWDRFLKSI